MMIKYFHTFYIFQKSYFYQSWRLVVAYLFQYFGPSKYWEWKRLVQLLVGKPILAKLHMGKANMKSIFVHKENLNTF